MNQYICLDICPFNIKKEKEFQKYKGRIFNMQDKQYRGSNIELEFKEGVLKAKLVDIQKEKETNYKKKFVITTNTFTAIIQLLEAYNKEQTNEG